MRMPQPPVPARRRAGMLTRDAAMPRNTGSPSVPPLRSHEKPGMGLEVIGTVVRWQRLPRRFGSVDDREGRVHARCGDDDLVEGRVCFGAETRATADDSDTQRARHQGARRFLRMEALRICVGSGAEAARPSTAGARGACERWVMRSAGAGTTGWRRMSACADVASAAGSGSAVAKAPRAAKTQGASCCPRPSSGVAGGVSSAWMMAVHPAVAVAHLASRVRGRRRSGA